MAKSPSTRSGLSTAPMATATAIAVALVLSSCVSNIQSTEDDLAAAGFVVRPANTPARQAMLKRLPPNRFLIRTRGNNVSYVYADPVNCNCLYVGNQQAYDAYRRAKQQERIANRELWAAQTYADAQWHWDVWGPGQFYDFGPWGPGFGW